MPDPSFDPDRLDSEVLSELMRIRGELNYFISSAIPNHSDAEDVFQESCLKIWKGRHKFDPGTDFRAWAFTIARFTIMDWRKRFATRRLQYLDSETIEILMNEIADEVLESGTNQPFMEAMESCLHQLDPDQEKLMQLHYRDRLPLADLAQRRSKTVSGVKQALYRTRQKLRRCIELRVRLVSVRPTPEAQA